MRFLIVAKGASGRYGNQFQNQACQGYVAYNFRRVQQFFLKKKDQNDPIGRNSPLALQYSLNCTSQPIS